MSTPNLSISVIALALTQACSPSALAQTAEANLTEVVITGVKSSTHASVAGFADLPLLQTPAAVNVITHEQMQDLSIRSTTDAVKFDASVSDSYNAVGYAEQFSMRGFNLDNSSSYRKDGLAIPADTQIPLENKERIEILKGLAGFQAGVAAPGGIIDYIVKRPTLMPLRSVTVETGQRGALYGSVDLGGRFDDPRFGYRINAAAEKMRPSIEGADGNRTFISGAFDWQISPRALLQLDADYQGKSQVTAPGFQLLGGALPTNVSADTMLNAQPWSKPVTTRSSNLGLRFAYQINDDWRASFAANRHVLKRDDYTAFPYGCNQSLATFCANGDFDVYDYKSLGEKKSPVAAQALLQGEFNAAALRHALTLGASWFRREDQAGAYLYAYAGASNVYKPLVVAPASGSSGPVTEVRNENEQAVFAQDIVTLSPQWKLHAGLRYVQVKRNQFFDDAGNALVVHTDNGFALPNLALVYNPLSNVALYGAYSQGVEHGSVATFGTSNAGSALSPSKSKQIEMGVKADLTPRVMVSATLFQIRKGLEYTNGDNLFVRNGQAQNRGLELAAQGRVSTNLRLGWSVLALNTQQEGTGDAHLDGKRVTNVPALKSSLYADYAVPQVTGLNLNSTWLYAGKKAFDSANSIMVPGYHVLNLGLAYATKIGASPVILRATADNVCNRFYWRDVSPELGGYLFPGASRSLKMSAQVDF